MDKEIILFCDESDGDGRYFSYFYGGALVGSSNYMRVTSRLNDCKTRLNLFGEIKWSKVTESYLEKYIEIMRTFFDEIRAGAIRVRIMFMQNAKSKPLVTPIDYEDLRYFKLYYQFVKHAFGLDAITAPAGSVRLRLYFDRFPTKYEEAESFRGYLMGLGRSHEFQRAGLALHPDDITEIESHAHVILQCVDIVLGAMSFRLNDKHKEKPTGSRTRGKRTIAKEKLYKFILAEIRKTHPGFNAGISTGGQSDRQVRLNSPYLHWCFKPYGALLDKTKTKPKNKKRPQSS
jgi:hypothetical protein